MNPTHSGLKSQTIRNVHHIPIGTSRGQLHTFKSRPERIVWNDTQPRIRRLSAVLNGRVESTREKLLDAGNWEEDEVLPTDWIVQEMESWLRVFYRELVIPTKDLSLLPHFSLSGTGRFGFYWNTSRISGIIHRTHMPHRFIATIRQKATGKKESKDLDLDVDKPWSDDWAWLRQNLRK